VLQGAEDPKKEAAALASSALAGPAREPVFPDLPDPAAARLSRLAVPVRVDRARWAARAVAHRE
jgi:hypothetical protein